MLKILRSLQEVMVGCAVVMLSHFAIGDAAANEWRVISELPTPRGEFATAVVDRKIYLIGGTPLENLRGVRRENEPGIWKGPFGMTLVEVYDPQTNTWQRLTDMPTVRSGAKAAVVNGKIYVLSGRVGKDRQAVNLKVLKVVEMYDPQTDTWVRKQDMSRHRMAFGIGVIAGKIYTIGGTTDAKPGDPWRVDLVEVYDPATDTWAKRADMPTRRRAVKAAVIRDTLYAIGGGGWPPAGAGGPFLGTIEVYEPRINRWTKRPEMPNPRTVFFSVVIDEKIYLIGGLRAGDSHPAPIEVYEPATERWRLVSARSTIKSPFGVAAVNGNIYIFGGKTENRELSPIVEVFDTGFRNVEARGKLPTRWGQLKVEYQGQSQRD
ncbi:hypothetical protein F4X88_14955 [Candidatus Poribacteria bacterium]|nr:hypothetical protein [Candidatus Poribacteria bacterium]MYA57586.1 hypothetical protein [Candidatus Poribacteria bacterium]